MADLLYDLLPHKGEVKFPGSPPPEGTDVLWRCEAKSYSYVIDPETERYGSTSPVLEMHWYRVVRWTRTGARLENGKLVFLNQQITNRQWASRTPAEALAAFKARRERQIRILARQLEYAKLELALTEGAKL